MKLLANTESVFVDFRMSDAVDDELNQCNNRYGDRMMVNLSDRLTVKMIMRAKRGGDGLS